MWTVTTFHAEEDLFLPAIRPAVVLIAHAESEERVSHAESAENAEPVSHAEFAESAEFCLVAATVPTGTGGATGPDSHSSNDPPAQVASHTTATPC